MTNVLNNLPEIGDIILTKDGLQLRVLSVRKDGERILFLEGVDDNAPSPMRTRVQQNNFQRILRKNPNPIDPKTNKPVNQGASK